MIQRYQSVIFFITKKNLSSAELWGTITHGFFIFDYITATPWLVKPIQTYMGAAS